MDSALLLIVLAAFVGGLVSALMGWGGSIPPEPLDLRKFGTSLGSALVAGIIYAVTIYVPGDNSTKSLLSAFLWGAGGDALVNRAIGYLQTKNVNTLPPVKPA